MNDWQGLRTIAVIVAWITVVGGALLDALWIGFGGVKSIGPEDELMAQAGVPVARSERRYTALSSAQVGMHGFFGIATAGLLTHAATRPDDRRAGYFAVLVVAAVTIFVGALMFRKWRSPRRPAVDGNPAGDRGAKVEDRLPRAAVFFNGAAAAAVVLLVDVLVAVE
jgi:hypothetical protein